jgi:hypothetical protein
MSTNYVIWSLEHNGWWARARCGYVEQLADAGLYSPIEAEAIEADANRTGQINELALPVAQAEVLEMFFDRLRRELRQTLFYLLASAERGRRQHQQGHDEPQ